MTHEMKLQPAPFEQISAGTKTYELRLYDEKRRTIQTGDRIIFTNTRTDEQLTVEVIGLYRFDTFAQLYETLPLERCGYAQDEVQSAGPEDMLAYYPAEKQSCYGVVAIEIRCVY